MNIFSPDCIVRKSTKVTERGLGKNEKTEINHKAISQAI